MTDGRSSTFFRNPRSDLRPCPRNKRLFAPSQIRQPQRGLSRNFIGLFFLFHGGLKKMSGLRSRIGRYLSSRELRGFESRLTCPSVRTKIPKNLVVIMKEVGRQVSLLTDRVTFDLPAARLARMVRFMSRQIIAEREPWTRELLRCGVDVVNLGFLSL